MQITQTSLEGRGINLQAEHAEAVTVGNVYTAGILYVGGTGNITAITVGGDTVTFTAVPTGFILPVLITEVTAATATAMVMLR